MSVADGTLDGARHGPVRDPPCARQPRELAPDKRLAGARLFRCSTQIAPIVLAFCLGMLPASPQATSMKREPKTAEPKPPVRCPACGAIDIAIALLDTGVLALQCRACSTTWFARTEPESA